MGAAETLSGLEASRDFFEQTVGGIPESEATLRQAPDTWTILGIVEHIVVAERALLARLTTAHPSDSVPRDPAREARLAAGLKNRSAPVKAPERAQPAGRFSSLADALRHFLEARNKTIRFARERAEELYSLTAEHPFFGTVNGIEMLIVMAGHSDRHADQIVEIRSLKSERGHTRYHELQ
jgi:hypothetical protein